MLQAKRRKNTTATVSSSAHVENETPQATMTRASNSIESGHVVAVSSVSHFRPTDDRKAIRNQATNSSTTSSSTDAHISGNDSQSTATQEKHAPHQIANASGVPDPTEEEEYDDDIQQEYGTFGGMILCPLI